VLPLGHGNNGIRTFVGIIAWSIPAQEHLMERRTFFHLGSAAAAWSASPLAAANAAADPLLQETIARLDYLTPLDRAFILDKGKADVGKLSPAELRQAGLVPESWSLDVIPDPASDSAVEQPLSRTLGNALDWRALMKLAEKHAVRFLHVCVCTNGADPFHMTLWEGVPLREVIWLTRPKANLRRVCYQSFHRQNIPPFQASLPLGQVLETPPGQMPVILAYKMNGRLIPASHGGPVRMLVPGAYGSKQIKWVQRLLLTNDYKSNDSDAELNNDTESAMKTRARFIHAPKQVPRMKPAAIAGFAQIGISGLRKVQYCVQPLEQSSPASDPYWTRAPWKDAFILPPPENWGGGLPDGKLPAHTGQADPAKGTFPQWPLRYTIAHWAALLPALPPGRYHLCCRTIDGNGIAQPMPRPFPRTGANTIHRLELLVKG
jgi:DMSO/TMAO reductase YedYZ molybdopterin-dependent catalytic subunit